MTLPQNVADALKSQDQSAEDSPYDESAWQTIRAHLMSQEAEIELLQVGAERRLLQAQMLESRLAAANALLQKIHAYGYWPSYRDEVARHLQGAGE